MPSIFGEVGNHEVRGELFVIPKKAPTNEHGFVILPVVPDQQRRKRCLLCGNCSPNVHHAYWPKPASSPEIEQLRLRQVQFRGLPDYTKELFAQLRSAPFSISTPICEYWHGALHKLQNPPKELPDKNIITLGLEQHQRIMRVMDRSSLLSELVGKPRTHARIEKEVGILSALMSDLPTSASIVIPTIGYLCMRTVDMETESLPTQPIISIKNVAHRAKDVIREATVLLS